MQTTAWLVFMIIVAQLGTEPLGIHRIVLNVMTLAIISGLAFRHATTVLVGHSIGTQRPTDALLISKIAMRWAVGWLGLLGLLFFFGGDLIVQLYSNEPQVIQTGTKTLRVFALVQPIWAISMLQAGALRGLGNTQYPFVVGCSGIWGGVLLGWYLAQLWPNDLSIYWNGFLLTAPIQSFLMYRRFRQEIRQLLPAT